MRPSLLAAAVVVALPALAKEPEPLSLVGRPLPEPGAADGSAWRGEEAWRVGDQAAGPDDPTEWAAAIWTRDRQAAVFFTLRGVVKDVLTVEVPDGDRLLGHACVVGGVGTLAPEVVVLAPRGERCRLPHVRTAWRLDRGLGRIVPIATDGLRCQDSSRGCD